jgi:ubiquinone/menaquinone biosynthesis C-methylase UbiE
MEGNATHLEFPDASFDAAVASFLFCVLPDELQLTALKEIGRVVKPNGTIRLLEYTRPHGGVRRVMTKLWEPWVHWAYGASFDRRTEQLIPDAGLVLIGARYVVDELIRLIEAKPRA